MTTDKGLESRLGDRRRALVLGIGGGGDVVGALPTARFLEFLGIEAILGGLSWERYVHDPHPGSRTLEEVRGVRPLSPTVWLAGPDSATVEGIRFAETETASVLGTDIVLVDLSAGVEGVVDGLRKALAVLEADLLVGIDVGGDSLAMGDEPGLRSPLADSMMLAAFDRLSSEVAAIWGVIGYGSDGELSPAEVEQALADMAGRGALLGAWGVTPAAAAEMERLVEVVPTEASRIVVQAMRGELGSQAIRDRSREVRISPVCTVTFYLDVDALASRTPLTTAVRSSRSLEEASDSILALGVRSEYQYERDLAARAPNILEP